MNSQKNYESLFTVKNHMKRPLVLNGQKPKVLLKFLRPSVYKIISPWLKGQLLQGYGVIFSLLPTAALFFAQSKQMIWEKSSSIKPKLRSNFSAKIRVIKRLETQGIPV